MKEILLQLLRMLFVAYFNLHALQLISEITSCSKVLLKSLTECPVALKQKPFVEIFLTLTEMLLKPAAL